MAFVVDRKKPVQSIHSLRSSQDDNARTPAPFLAQAIEKPGTKRCVRFRMWLSFLILRRQSMRHLEG
jgi:hypothetical protein